MVIDQRVGVSGIVHEYDVTRIARNKQVTMTVYRTLVQTPSNRRHATERRLVRGTVAIARDATVINPLTRYGIGMLPTGRRSRSSQVLS